MVDQPIGITGTGVANIRLRLREAILGNKQTRTTTICCAASRPAKYGPCEAWSVSFSRHCRGNDMDHAAHGPYFAGQNAVQHMAVVFFFLYLQ